MSLQVIIVDDDDVTLFVHRMMMTVSKFHTHPILFTEVELALGYLNESNDPGNTILILLDINMPVAGGWEMLDALEKSEFSSDIKVIVVTSSVNSADKRRVAQYSKVISYYEKPITVKALEALKTDPGFREFFPESQGN